MTSVFAAQRNKLFARYHCEIEFRDRIYGGVPKNPKVIEGWLMSRMGLTDQEEIAHWTARTLREMGVEVNEGMTLDEMEKLATSVAGQKQTNGFKHDEQGLYIEARQVKAAIKESVSILFPYAIEKWGVAQARGAKGGKTPWKFAAEAVFVNPDHIHLDRTKPDGEAMMMIHTDGPQGPVNSLAYHEYVEKARIAFDVLVTRDAIEHEKWPEIWLQAEQIGLGACRSQSAGQFDVVAWDEAKD